MKKYKISQDDFLILEKHQKISTLQHNRKHKKNKRKIKYKQKYIKK